MVRGGGNERVARIDALHSKWITCLVSYKHYLFKSGRQYKQNYEKTILRVERFRLLVLTDSILGQIENALGSRLTQK